MKIGDIVIYCGTEAKIISWSNLNSKLILITYDSLMQWVNVSEVESLNCSVGKAWNRYEHRNLGLDYHDMIDRYTGKVVGKYRSHD